MKNISDLVDDKIRDIKGKAMGLLQQMPEREDFSVRLADGDYSIAVWKDEGADGTVRIVVQAYRHLVLGSGSMTARGFAISAEHGIRDLRQDELWEFM